MYVCVCVSVSVLSLALRWPCKRCVNVFVALAASGMYRAHLAWMPHAKHATAATAAAAAASAAATIR